MSCHPESEKQRDYAESLVEYLEKEQHRSAARYKQKVADCSCIKEMSRMIDEMIELRDEVKEADEHVKGGW